MKIGTSVKLRDVERLQLAGLLTIAKMCASPRKEVKEGEIFIEFLTMLYEVTGRWHEVEEVLRPKDTQT